MLVKAPIRRFVLKGFSQHEGTRNFRFECVDEDRTRIEITVQADLALARRFGISFQELPLLCLELVERRTIGSADSVLLYTEKEMSQVSADRKAAREAAVRNRKQPARRSPSGEVGIGWRTTAPLSIRNRE